MNLLKSPFFSVIKKNCTAKLTKLPPLSREGQSTPFFSLPKINDQMNTSTSFGTSGVFQKKKALEHGVSNIEGERGKRRTRREGELEMMKVKAFPLLKLICWQLI